MSIQQLERQLTEERRDYERAEENYRLMMDQSTRLRNSLHQLQQEETTRLQKVDSPFARDTQKLEKERGVYEKARADFERAQEQYRKAEARFQKAQEDFTKQDEKHSRSTQDVRKTINLEEKRLEREIERKEREANSWRLKAENARRDVELLQRRINDERRSEMEAMQRKAANRNHTPAATRRTTDHYRDAA